MYKGYYITVRTDNRYRVDAILDRHDRLGEIDRIDSVCGQRNADGTVSITYRIAPYIYEDLEAIMDEFKRKGIRVL